MKQLPLKGVRVADLSMMWAGPFCTRLLGEMGAEIIKIESPRAWDNVRTLFPQPGAPEPWNTAYYFNDYNRDKKSLTLDLSQPRGKALFLELIAQCDCVIENYRADVLDKLGIGYEALCRVKPDIVLISMAGFGKTGAEKGLVGFGPIIEMMAGLTSLAGYGDDGVPYKTGISYGDPIGGIAGAGAALTALIRRKRTGKGAWVDLAQRETMAQMLAEAFAAASLRKESPTHRGNRDKNFAPQGVYPAAGEDQWVAVSARSDSDWRALARAIGAGELEALSLEQRRERHAELDRRIAAWTQTRAADEIAASLQGVGVPASRVQDCVSIHSDPQLEARGSWVELPHPKMKTWKQPASAWRLEEARPRPKRHAPLFGEHNREILCGLLGHSEAELAELSAAGVIGDAPVNPGVG
jgi:crotonobetainyl-CoA:carnitine CoA-transferase CaiB-like acyl-CoA transferase